ncbi:MAG: sigma-70 family RNA polymerase sigma factor [Chloroflexi bacterium]|nr:sigma-70 family RNA polymerase sigma factor [Chloroflexota bacterium]
METARDSRTVQPFRLGRFLRPETHSRAAARPEAAVVPQPPCRADADRALIELCLRGDEEAWEHLIRAYGGLIYSVARRYGLNEAEAADVFQSVCLALWEGLGSLRETSKLTSWLTTVTARAAWHCISARGRGTAGPLDDTVDLPDGAGNQPEEEALRRERAQSLREALAFLPERWRRLMWHLYYDPAAPSYAEVAQILGMPEGSIGPTRARCLKRLQMILEKMDVSRDLPSLALVRPARGA